MNNDLISREALKNELHNYFDGKVIDEPAYILRDFFCYIDNAPTVETDKELKILKIKAETYQTAYKLMSAASRRPQGEWIEKYYSDYGVYYRCSICHKMPPNYECDYKEGAIKTNFCPNCGADMRKPNCVTCDHFGKCEGCEKGEEE